MVYATLVQYFCDIPASDAVTFLGMPISGKILIYSMALQVIQTDCRGIFLKIPSCNNILIKVKALLLTIS